MSVVYIAGPMSGLPDFNYPAFNAAALALHAAGHDPRNPADTEALNDTGRPQTWDWYMRHALRMVLDSEGVALLPGWEASRGATLEHRVATELGLTVRPINEWVTA